MTEKAASEPQAAAFADRVDGFLRRNQTRIAWTACVLAFVRILIFAAAFPLFNPVDEQDHYEMVYRFSQGYLPGKELPTSDPEMARVFALYGSPEYLNSRALLRSLGRDKPIGDLPEGPKEHHYRKAFDYWRSQPDIEAQSPPVYYLVAAAWTKLGAAWGEKDWALVYWVRFLNAGLYAVFVWISYLFVKEIYPRRDFLCLAVPLLLAVFPQDVFFGVNRDVLSPLLAALVLLLLFRAMRGGEGSGSGLIAGGLLVGIAFLTDVPNVVLFGVLAVALYFAGKRAPQGGASFAPPTAIAGSVMGALLLPLLWMLRNRLVIGDVTGSHAKTAYLGWTLKPWPEMWRHPIFSWQGGNYFVHELTRTYWRGEYVWEGIRMRGAFADGFYVVSSQLMLLAFVAYLLGRGKVADQQQRLAGFLSLYLVLASVLFLAVISLPFDFRNCVYPSRQLPYFVSGRIICGSLLPFALIYVSGFEFLLRPVRRYLHPIFPFLAVCAGIMYSEIVLSRGVFTSSFNFFALLWK